MIHLQSIHLPTQKHLPDYFPFSVPVVRSLSRLNFSNEMTFFVGENGSGKSTILEAVAVAAGLPTIGSHNVAEDETLKAIRELSDMLKWSWSRRVSGFFMRSEDFFGFAKRINETVRSLEADLDEDMSHEGQSEFAQRLMQGPLVRERAALKAAYGDGLDAQSHGESYFKLFRSRFRPNSIYLLDEPEAPLSPMRQLSLIALLHEMVQQGGQFIIATHSPILLAYPNATIYNFEAGQITQVDYDDLEHVTLTRSFLNNPNAFLRYLIDS